MINPYRPRRTRSSAQMRDLVAETAADRNKLIMPYFVEEGRGIRGHIPSMPGIERVSPDNLIRDLEKDFASGITKIILFGIPGSKDERASGAMDRQGIIQKALREIKKNLPGMLVITDVCLCEYMSHGHCGIVENGKVLNDPSLELLADTALSHAEAGADIVAPSDMMDGRVGVIRDLLEEKGFHDTAVMAYSAKYSSAFYGPFRDAAGSAPRFGDRKTYQMDYRNTRESLREVFLDVEEGADIVMVKPALSYLDIIREVRVNVDMPLCAYNVSGEYSMVKSAAEHGWVDEESIVREIICSIFRAGADMIISYHTRDVFLNGWL